MPRLIDRHAGALIVGLRFAYGLPHRRAGADRHVAAVGGPLAIFNAIGALLWARRVGGAGWLFGSAAQALLGDLRHLEGWLFWRCWPRRWSSGRALAAGALSGPARGGHRLRDRINGGGVVRRGAPGPQVDHPSRPAHQRAAADDVAGNHGQQGL